MNRPTQEIDERIFTVSDVKRLFQKKKRAILRAALFGWIIAFGFTLLTAPKYKFEATFKESANQNPSSHALKDLLLNFSTAPTQPEAATTMKSYQILKPLVSKLGLQASVPLRGPLSKIRHRIQDNLRAERKKKLEDFDEFFFRDVLYEGEEPLRLFLRFDEPDRFSLLRTDKTLIAQGVLGKEVGFPQGRLTLFHVPKNLRLRRLYPLHLAAWTTVANALRKQLKITSSKSNKSIYDLLYFHRNRFLGVAVLNGLMEEYQRYLKRSHDQLSKEQLFYLDQRQEEILHKMALTLQEHADYFSRNLAERGFISLGDQKQDHLSPHHLMANQVLAIEVELAKLKQFEQEGGWLASAEASPSFARLSEIAHMIQDLNHQEDLLELSLHNKTEASDNRSAIRHQELFEGIDLSTARALFTNYNNQLDGHEALLCRYEQLREEIPRENFAISSLSSVLQDTLSQNLITQASILALQLRDEQHHSEKEGKRWREDLRLQKKILADHLEQLLKITELNVSLIREKMSCLQQISLDCIHRQIAVLHEQAADFIAKRSDALRIEKNLLEEKMAEFRASMADLPEKWRLQEWLHLKTEMGTKIIEALTQLTESKTIGHHLHHVESKPLDLSIQPIFPERPNLFAMGFLGAFLASFGVFFSSLLKTVFRGFPSSLEKLRAMRFPLLGEISSFCDGPAMDLALGDDLETLRQANLFLEKSPQAKIIALLAGKGPDYSYAFAQNLSRISLRSLIIRCDFQAKYQDADLPGLLQFWNREIETLPIRSMDGFDLLTSGGFTPFGNELLQSKRFEQLLAPLKEQYDYLFLLIRSPLSQSESHAALRLADKAIVTVSGEPTEVLTPFVDWAYSQEESRLMFITLQPA